MKRELVEFLKPNKKKIFLALLLPAFWFGIVGGGIEVFRLIISSPVLVLSYIIDSIFYYPFSCALVLTFEHYKRKEMKVLVKNKSFLLLIFLGIVVFNPLGIALLQIFLISILNPSLHPSPGLKVIEVYPESPTLAFYRSIEGEVINEIDDVKIYNLTQALEILSKKKPNEDVRIGRTGQWSATYVLAKHENLTQGYLGIKVRDAQGNEAVL